MPVYGFTTSFGPFIAIVSPWAESGNLTAYLEHEKNASLSVVRRFQIASILLYYMLTRN